MLHLDDYSRNYKKSIDFYEKNKHYIELLCLNKVNCNIKIEEDTLKYLTDLQIDISDIHVYNYKCCILPKNHSGKCSYDIFPKIFQKNEITDKLKTSIRCSIYSTPGDDDYVYKNRASRLYPIMLSNEIQKKIRNTKIKKKCAIPLKESSSPILLAQAYIDY